MKKKSKKFLFKFSTAKSKNEFKVLTIIVDLPITKENLESYPFLTFNDGSFGIPANGYSIDTEKSSPDYEDWFDINEPKKNGLLTVNSKTKSRYCGFNSTIWGYNWSYERRPLIVHMPPEPIPIN